MGERSGAPSGLTPPSIVISKPPVAVHLPQPDVSANRDAPHCASASDAAILAGQNLAVNPTNCYNSNGNAVANQTSVQQYAAQQSYGLNPAPRPSRSARLRAAMR